jgi:hypothetical protein
LFFQGVAIVRSGNINFASTDDRRIRKVNVATGNITTVAGTGAGGYDGHWIMALLAPSGAVLDGPRNIYIGDTRNQRIRKKAHETPTGLPSVAPSTYSIA